MVNIAEQSDRWIFAEAAFIPEIVLLGYDNLKMALPLSEHTHRSCIEFVYVERGRTVWEVDGRSFETKSGDVFTAFPDEVHKGNYDIIEPCRFWWIIVGLPGREASGNNRTSGQRMGWLRLTSDEERIVLKELLDLPRVVTLGPAAVPVLRKLQSAARRQGETDRLEGTMALLEFLLLLIRCGDRLQETNPTTKRVAEIIDGLPDRLDDNLAVPELAREAGLGTTHFYRLFREQTGLAPKAYMEYLRIEEASRRLRYTDESITSLSMDLGFATSQHFATAFRRIKGRTPTEWRRQGQTDG